MANLFMEGSNEEFDDLEEIEKEKRQAIVASFVHTRLLYRFSTTQATKGPSCYIKIKTIYLPVLPYLKVPMK